MKYLTAGLLLGLVFVTACNLSVSVTKGSGNVITESRSVSNFHKVDLAGFGELSITQGDTESLTIETDDNLLPLIETKVENGVLSIGPDSKRGAISVNPTHSIKYALHVKNLDALEISGAGNVNAPSLKSDTFTINTSGAGNLNLQQFETKTLTTSVSGAGNILLAGQVETQAATLSGFGNYDASNLKSTAADIRLSGAGNATVWASGTLNVQISGAGSVSYYGTPQVSQTISGIGAVKSLGSK